jgi:8-oxo-dGTP pyrophosphatase MutT (NUDIX family)
MEVLGGADPWSAGKDLHGGNLYTMGYLQNDAPVKGSGGNLLDDETNDRTHDLQSGLHAACCLVLRDDGKVLAVSRKDDPTLWGMIGGKVDPGETPEEAAARECKEETGLTAVHLNQVFEQQDDDGFTTTTFACQVEGEINTDEAGVVKWVDIETLISDQTSPFVRYNKNLFRTLGLLKRS